MFVVGTAGHVDHGKSTLIEKLTGIDPDRLRAEKSRGMTIELGFAWLALDDENEISIVDVPGHERFIKTMLMGAGGFDIALLVVAGDEGPMPQTREHLAILDLLEVHNGIVVITKSDLADQELIELVEIEVSELLENTSLEGSPTIAVSAETGEGMAELYEMIVNLAGNIAKRNDNGHPRLFVDRSFSVAGFGAVITGTLDGGQFSVGDEVMMLPSGETARIRGLQSHKSEISVARPGSRVAISLSGVTHTEIERGEALVKRGQFKSTTVFDASIRSIADVKRPIKHNHRVTLYAGTWEEPATIRLLNRDVIEAGESGWAQIKLGSQRPIIKGDRFVIRDSNDTLGGGVTLVVDAPRHRRNDDSVTEHLSILSAGKSEDVLLHVMELLRIANPSQIADATHSTLSEVRSDIATLLERTQLVELNKGANPLYTTQREHQFMLQTCQQALADYHRRYPLRRGMPREELRNRLKLRGGSFDAFIADLVQTGCISQDGTATKLPDHVVEFSDEQKREVDRYLGVLREHRYSPPAWNKIDDELLGALASQRQVVSAGPDVVFAAEVYDEMRDVVIRYCQANREISINDVRGLLGTSRKYSLALLEQLDRENVTMRVGDMRLLR